MRCASRNVGIWLAGGGDAESTEGSNVDGYMLLTFVVMAWYALSRHWAQTKVILTQNKSVVALFIFMAISITWSEIPFDSTKRWIRASGDLAMALILATQPDPFAALKLIFRRAFILLIPLSIILSKFFPNLGRAQEKNWSANTWIGVATHKNTLGMLVFMSAFYFLVQLISAKRKSGRSWVYTLLDDPIDVLYLLLSLYLLTGGGAESNSVSSTSLLLFLLSSASFIGFGWFRKRPKAIRSMLILTAVFLIITQALLSLFDSSIRAVVASSQGKDPTLAERTILWDALLKEGADKSLLGAGFGGFWSERMSNHMQTIFSWGPGQSHNGYIETYLNIGIVGLSLLILTALNGLRSALRRCTEYFDHGVWCLILLICALIHNYSEAGFPRPTHVVWFVFLVVVLNTQSNALPPSSEGTEGSPHPQSIA